MNVSEGPLHHTDNPTVTRPAEGMWIVPQTPDFVLTKTRAGTSSGVTDWHPEATSRLESRESGGGGAVARPEEIRYKNNVRNARL